MTKEQVEKVCDALEELLNEKTKQDTYPDFGLRVGGFTIVYEKFVPGRWADWDIERREVSVSYEDILKKVKEDSQ